MRATVLLLAATLCNAPAPLPRPQPVVEMVAVEEPSDREAEPTWPEVWSLDYFPCCWVAEFWCAHHQEESNKHARFAELFLFDRDQHLVLSYEHHLQSTRYGLLCCCHNKLAWTSRPSIQPNEREYLIRDALNDLRLAVGDSNFYAGRIAAPHPDEPAPHK